MTRAAEPAPEGAGGGLAPLSRRALIVGLAGCRLTADEAQFLAEVRPCGVIIFTRNFSDDEQLSELIAAAREAIGTGDVLVAIDQEGGRVQRLRGGNWPDVPPAAAFGRLYERDAPAALEALRVVMEGLGSRLKQVGINTNCAPCVDVPVAGADDVIGDRAYGRTPEMVAELGRAAAEGLMAAGVVAVVKHVPGHGRAMVDSHKALPVVRSRAEELRGHDFVPFAALSDMPAAMSAHVTFEAFDCERPATVSPVVMGDIVRGEIGFDGLVMSDDLSMGALAGTVGERAAAALAAGCDVALHCNGVIEEMREVAACCGALSGAALERFRRCLAVAGRPAVAVDPERFEDALALVRDAGGGDGGDGGHV